MCSHNKPKYTRGEKCIFAHIVVTLAVILVAVIVYLVHLFLVKHEGYDAIRITRRSHNEDGNKKSVSVGILYLNQTPATIICNALLIKKQWSLTAGHCAAMRTYPDLYKYLPLWTMRYEIGGYHRDSNIIRSFPHPHFNVDDFNNNVGLIQHDPFYGRELSYIFKQLSRVKSLEGLLIEELDCSKLTGKRPCDNDALNEMNRLRNLPVSDNLIIGDNFLEKNAFGMILVGSTQFSVIAKGGPSITSSHPVQALSMNKCKQFTSSIIELRDYEFCVTLYKQTLPWKILYHGAVLCYDDNPVAIVGWGDRQGRGMPFVMLRLHDFRDWVKFVVSPV